MISVLDCSLVVDTKHRAKVQPASVPINRSTSSASSIQPKEKQPIRLDRLPEPSPSIDTKTFWDKNQAITS